MGKQTCSRIIPRKAVSTNEESHKQAPTPTRDAASRRGCNMNEQAQRGMKRLVLDRMCMCPRWMMNDVSWDAMLDLLLDAYDRF